MRRTVASSALSAHAVPVTAALLILGLGGCSGGDDPESSPAPTTATSTPGVTTTPGAGGTATPGGTAGGTGTAAASPVVDVCGEVDAADVTALFGGQAAAGVPAPAPGSDGGCRWALSGATVAGGAGAVTVSVEEGVTPEAFAAAHADPAAAAPTGGVGDAAYLEARAHTLTFLQGDRVTTVTGDFGAYDPARFEEARIQTALVGFGALLASRIGGAP